jgi:hypothetical protein
MLTIAAVVANSGASHRFGHTEANAVYNGGSEAMLVSTSCLPSKVEIEKLNENKVLTTA